MKSNISLRLMTDREEDEAPPAHDGTGENEESKSMDVCLFCLIESMGCKSLSLGLCFGCLKLSWKEDEALYFSFAGIHEKNKNALVFLAGNECRKGRTRICVDCIG
ncbi:unnamed protein product [Lactuca saligna]|uniref:Uncharacterized protein n=1 Tax=Lactuca saligna TaxID=75948 RepID=A0AA36E439_LACSI|nr:unnamed protein product [Lactuca saligna]